MATPNFRPNANNEGKLGTNTHRWAEANATQIKEAGVRVATVASPALTGTPTAPTASASTSTTQIATTAFVNAEIAADITGKANLASPALSGTPTAPTASASTSTTQIATTAFVIAECDPLATKSSPALTGTPTAPTAGTSTDTTQVATTAYVKANTATKANLASPALSGTPTAPTASVSTSTTQLATTAFVGAEIAADIAPLATKASPALTGTPTAPTAGTSTDTTQIATTAYVKANTADKAGLSSPALTGTPTAPTASVSTDTTQIATTAFVGAEIAADIASKANLASPELTGTPIAPTAGTSTDTTQIATTAYVKANLASYAASSHTHTSANISDAASAATASKVVIRDGTGAALFASTGSGKAVQSTASGSSGYGLYGGSTGSNSYSVFGFNTGTSGTAGHFANGATSGVGLVADNNQAAGAVIFSARHSTDPMFNVYTGSKMRLYNTASTYYSEIDFGTITANRAVTWPDAAGTVVLGAGGGITDAGAFRTALGVGTGDSPVFTKTVVTSSASNGYNFSTGAKLVLEDASSTTVYSLPNDGSSAETLVDGDGRGITSASDFRTAIGAPVSTTGGFTGTVAINPASGSDVFALTGASGNTATISCNPGGNITIGMPTTNSKTLALVATATGLIIATDVSDSTAVGRSLITAVDAQAARTAIGYDGYIHASGDINSTDATTIASAGAFVKGVADNLVASVASGFSVPDVALCRVTYTGATTALFKVDVRVSAKTASGDDVVALRIGKNNTALEVTQVDNHVDSAKTTMMSASCVLSLANTNTVEAFVANMDTTANLVLTHTQIVVTPI